MKKDSKPGARLASLFLNNSGVQAEAAKRSAQNPGLSELAPQGKSLSVNKAKPVLTKSPDIARLIASEEDERYRYLLKHGNLKKVEDEDKILYAELPQIPGVLVVYRKPSERAANPERLNLDRRELTRLPLLEGEEKLKLLNFQHNSIQKIENLVSLPNLIFLDLYSNSIREISGLHTVPTLRVLMLGKNQIDCIKNLNALEKLDVLDLHSNLIAAIDNIAHLKELRVLNLANNQIERLERLEGLVSLTELNLRRNRIETVTGMEGLVKLQRLFLSNNRLADMDKVASLAGCVQLAELALDGNPLCTQKNYVSQVMMICQQLRILDTKKATKEIRENGRAPAPVPAMDTHKPVSSDQPVSSEALLTLIQSEWRAEVARLRGRSLNAFKLRREVDTESLLKSGHAELEGDTQLFLFGNALEVMEKPEFVSTVTQISFRFIRFDQIVQQIATLKKYESLRKVSFVDNNIHSFAHLSKLEQLPGLTALSLDSNDVCHTVLCRSFIVYRFPLLKEISGVEVSESDRSKAKQQFQIFDQVLSAPSLFLLKMSTENRETEKLARTKMRKHSEVAAGFVTSLLGKTVEAVERREKAERLWTEFALTTTLQTTKELSCVKTINEGTLSAEMA